MLLKDVLAECISYEEEKEWFEFKENIFVEDTIGEYISALSNSAAILGKAFAYIFWGISDKDHSVIGTTVNFDKAINNEPLQHYIARNLSPSISFYFEELKYKRKRVVCLVIPAAQIVPTAYKNERYIRIGSSKENIRKYPEREAFLFSTLT